MNLEEYVNAYYGGLLGISKEYGIRKGDDIMDTDKTDYFNTMYGAKVFSSLNNESDIFKLLPKDPWNSSGYRMLTTRAKGAHDALGTTADGTLGIAEGAGFPGTDTPDIVELEIPLKEVVTAWDITTKASTLSKADDGLGNIEGFLKENAATDHMYYMDNMLMAANHTHASANLESLDRLIGAKSELDAVGGSGSSVSAGDLDPYGATAGNFDRDGSNTHLDAQVSHPSHSSNLFPARTLSLDLLDAVISDILEKGGKYENLIMLTGYDTLEELKQLILSTDSGTAGQGAWRMMMEAQTPQNKGGVKSQPGMNLETRVGYYDSIPIFVSQHVLKATAAGGTSGLGTGISNIYIIDTANIGFRVAVPTTYVSNEDLGVTQKLAREYAFITGGQVYCTRFNTHGKIRDLKA